MLAVRETLDRSVEETASVGMSKRELTRNRIYQPTQGRLDVHRHNLEQALQS